MSQLICLSEQHNHSAWKWLPEEMTLDARPLATLLSAGWERPLFLLGDALDLPDSARLLRHTYHNPAPLFILPPLPAGDVAPLLDAPAPVTLVRQRADTITITPDLAQFVVAALVASESPTTEIGCAASAVTTLQVFCTEAIETALHTGTLATAAGKPVIWAYRPTRTATPVVWVAAQLLLISARTAPLDREALWQGLLAWAEANTRSAVEVGRTSSGSPLSPSASHLESASHLADPALLRAVVVAYAARPDLTCDALADWLATQLGIQTDAPTLAATLGALQNEGAVDAENRPQRERLTELVNTWSLRAWVRETRRMDQG